MVLVLISGRLVSGWGIRIVVFFFERNILLRNIVFCLRAEKCSAELYMVGSGFDCLAMHFR